MLTTALPQVVLRPLTVSDAQAYHDLLTSNRGHLTQHGNFVEETAWSLETVRSSLASCSNHTFGIWRHGALLGRVDLVPVEPPKYGLGYLLAASATGQGVATESVRAVMDWARDVLLAEAVFAGVTHGNSPSVAVLERLGFSAVQEFESYTRFRLCFT